MNGPGQRISGRRVMVLIVDDVGKVHGWDVEPAVASWRMNGLTNGRTNVHIDIDGPMRRKTRDMPGADLHVPELEHRWEIEP
jgi:hypothetical protein